MWKSFFRHLLPVFFFCLASCARRDPPGARTLATYERAGGKKLRIEYVDHRPEKSPLIRVVLTSDSHPDSILAKFECDYLQFSHMQPNSNLIIAMKKDTTSVNLDTYILKIPD